MDTPYKMSPLVSALCGCWIKTNFETPLVTQEGPKEIDKQAMKECFLCECGGVTQFSPVMSMPQSGNPSPIINFTMRVFLEHIIHHAECHTTNHVYCLFSRQPRLFIRTLDFPFFTKCIQGLMNMHPGVTVTKAKRIQGLWAEPPKNRVMNGAPNLKRIIFFGIDLADTKRFEYLMPDTT